MSRTEYTRRKFIKQTSQIGMGAGALLGMGATQSLWANTAATATVPALLGGDPVITSHDWPSWPIWKPATDEERLLKVMRSGVWSRNKVIFI